VSPRIDVTARSLRRFPRRGRRVPKLAGHQADFEIRESVVAPWRLIYRIEGERVTIIGVVDSRMDMHEWLDCLHLRFGTKES